MYCDRTTHKIATVPLLVSFAQLLISAERYIKTEGKNIRDDIEILQGRLRFRRKRNSTSFHFMMKQSY